MPFHVDPGTQYPRKPWIQFAVGSLTRAQIRTQVRALLIGFRDGSLGVTDAEVQEFLGAFDGRPTAAEALIELQQWVTVK